jgi:hypothetical protein
MIKTRIQLNVVPNYSRTMTNAVLNLRTLTNQRAQLNVIVIRNLSDNKECNEIVIDKDLRDKVSEQENKTKIKMNENR